MAAFAEEPMVRVGVKVVLYEGTFLQASLEEELGYSDVFFHPTYTTSKSVKY